MRILATLSERHSSDHVLLKAMDFVIYPPCGPNYSNRYLLRLLQNSLDSKTYLKEFKAAFDEELNWRLVELVSKGSWAEALEDLTVTAVRGWGGHVTSPGND